MEERMGERRCLYVVLTGPPGIGKTTLVKKACSVLKEKGVSLGGFYTEEVRSGRERTGFDVVLLSGTRAPLARAGSKECNKPQVGRFAVEVKTFESCVLPSLSSEGKSNSILVIDEVGKMELLSKKFKEVVRNYVTERRGIMLATVPAKTSKPIELVEMIKTHPSTCLITVDKENRDELVDKITHLIIDGLKGCTAEEVADFK